MQEEDDTTDEKKPSSSYEQASYKRWKEDYCYETFRQFLDRNNYKKHFTEWQSKLFDELIQYHTEKFNSRQPERLTYEKIGLTHEISAQRVKEIENEISITLKRLYDAWRDKQPDLIPISQRIEHFLRFDEMVGDDNIIYKFKFLLSWLKLNYTQGEQIVNDINKKDYSTTIFDVITDGGIINRKKSVFEVMEKRLHPKSWKVLNDFLEHGVVLNPKGKKQLEQINSIYDKCIQILQSYLIDLDSHIIRHKKYVDTINKKSFEAKV